MIRGRRLRLLPSTTTLTRPATQPRPSNQRLSMMMARRAKPEGIRLGWWRVMVVRRGREDIQGPGGASCRGVEVEPGGGRDTALSMLLFP